MVLLVDNQWLRPICVSLHFEESSGRPCVSVSIGVSVCLCAVGVSVQQESLWRWLDTSVPRAAYRSISQLLRAASVARGAWLGDIMSTLLTQHATPGHSGPGAPPLILPSYPLNLCFA